MAIKNCLVCGKEFKPCNTCVSGANDIYNWKKVTCCREHHDYLLPIIEYNRHEISKNEAKKQLEKAINEYGNITFADNIAGLANEILAEDKKFKRIKPEIPPTLDGGMNGVRSNKAKLKEYIENQG